MSTMPNFSERFHDYQGIMITQIGNLAYHYIIIYNRHKRNRILPSIFFSFNYEPVYCIKTKGGHLGF